MAQAFSRSPESAALVRTTLAVTRVAAGVADNVLPQQGTLLFNLRSHPQGVLGVRGGRDCLLRPYLAVRPLATGSLSMESVPPTHGVG